MPTLTSRLERRMALQVAGPQRRRAPVDARTKPQSCRDRASHQPALASTKLSYPQFRALWYKTRPNCPPAPLQRHTDRPLPQSARLLLHLTGRAPACSAKRVEPDRPLSHPLRSNGIQPRHHPLSHRLRLALHHRILKCRQLRHPGSTQGIDVHILGASSLGRSAQRLRLSTALSGRTPQKGALQPTSNAASISRMASSRSANTKGSQGSTSESAKTAPGRAEKGAPAKWAERDGVLVEPVHRRAESTPLQHIPRHKSQEAIVGPTQCHPPSHRDRS